MKNNIFDKILGKLTLVSAGLVFLYYLAYLILCLIGAEALKMAPFAILVLASVSLPMLFRRKLSTVLGRAYKPLRITSSVLLCVYALSVIVFWAYIGLGAAKTPSYYTEQYAAENDTGEDTVVLVFGCLTKGMTPSKTLKNRLDAAYELLVALPDALCVVSGSKGSSETVEEAVAMRGYLIDRGISSERIIMESKSRSTSENIRFTKELLEDLGLENKRVIGVSTDFHLKRIEIISKRYGFEIDTCASPSPSFWNHYISMIREYLSYIKMILFDKAVL